MVGEGNVCSFVFLFIDNGVGYGIENVEDNVVIFFGGSFFCGGGIGGFKVKR